MDARHRARVDAAIDRFATGPFDDHAGVQFFDKAIIEGFDVVFASGTRADARVLDSRARVDPGIRQTLK